MENAGAQIITLALRRAATGGEASFFLGTDIAPHVDAAKETACGCAGCFTAPNTLSILAHVFEEEGALDRLEAFTSLNGPAFYRLPVNEGTVTLIREDHVVPDALTAAGAPIIPFHAGETLRWRIEG